MEEMNIQGYWQATNAGNAGKKQDECKFFIGSNYKVALAYQNFAASDETQKANKQIKFSNAIIAIVLAFLLGAGVMALTTAVIVPAIIDAQTYAYSYNGSEWQKNNIPEEDYKIIFDEVCKSWKEDPQSFEEYKTVGNYMNLMLDSMKSTVESYGDALKSTYGIEDLASYVHYYAQQISMSYSLSSSADSSDASESAQSESGNSK